MTLRELNIGDRFIHANVKDKRKAVKYQVMDKPKFNRGHGSATRDCVVTEGKYKGRIVSKSCNLEVIKLPI